MTTARPDVPQLPRGGCVPTPRRAANPARGLVRLARPVPLPPSVRRRRPSCRPVRLESLARKENGGAGFTPFPLRGHARRCAGAAKPNGGPGENRSGGDGGLESLAGQQSGSQSEDAKGTGRGRWGRGTRFTSGVGQETPPPQSAGTPGPIGQPESVAELAGGDGRWSPRRWVS